MPYVFSYFLALLAFLAVEVLSVPGGDALTIARRRLEELRPSAVDRGVRCEKSEESEKTPAAESVPAPALLADPLRAWRLANAERLTAEDARLGHDPGGFCATHHRWLTYPEQQRGACSWCVPVDPEREPEYWATHWRRFAERR